MKDKLVWRFIVPTLYKIPITRNWAARIYGRKLGSIVADCINLAEKIKTEPLWNNSPLLAQLKDFAVITALMPVAYIYQRVIGLTKR